jgi:hypothetical protein
VKAGSSPAQSPGKSIRSEQHDDDDDDDDDDEE